MGSSSSKSSTSGPSQSKSKNGLSNETKEAILIPPSFLVPSPFSPLSPTCLADMKVSGTKRPSLMEYLFATTPGARLLNDFMHPSLTLSVGSSPDRNILIRMDPSASNFSDSDDSKVKTPSGFIWGNNHIVPDRVDAKKIATVEALFPTTPGDQSLLVRGYVIPDKVSVSGQINASRTGWFDTRWNHSSSNVQVEAGAYVPFQSGKKVDTATLYGAVDYRETLASAEVDVPTSVDAIIETKPKVRCFASFNVSDEKTQPLWVTIRTENDKNKKFSVNLAQTFTFNRINLNAMDDRAPRVSQSLGWTVQLDQIVNEDLTSPGAATTQLSLGGAWQINRGLGVKALCTQDSLKYGVVLKRWKHPGIVMSFLSQFDFAEKNHSFLGVGLELTTTGNPFAEYREDSKKYRQDRAAPETKVGFS